MSASSWLSPDGSQGSAVERLCAHCFDADKAASDALARDVRVRLADGSIFAEIRAQLAAAEVAGDRAGLANAAEFIDLMIAGLDVRWSRRPLVPRSRPAWRLPRPTDTNKASTCSAISVATFGKRFIRKWVAPMRIFSVPNGCSTVSRRCRIACGFSSSRFCAASITCSCSQREMTRYLAFVQRALSGHVTQACVQYLRMARPSSTVAE